MEVEQRVKVVEVLSVGSPPPVVLDAATPVAEVLRRMREGRSGCALLTREGRLAGIFTERDVLLKLLGTSGAGDRRAGEGGGRPVSDWMTADPICVTETDPIRKAVLLMRQQGFRNVPVVDSEHRVVGCVRHKDIVRYLAEHYAAGVLNLPPDPDRVARTREGA